MRKWEKENIKDIKEGGGRKEKNGKREADWGRDEEREGRGRA